MSKADVLLSKRGKSSLSEQLQEAIGIIKELEAEVKSLRGKKCRGFCPAPEGPFGLDRGCKWDSCEEDDDED